MDDRTKQLLALGREHYEKREFERAEHYLSQIRERAGDYADVHNMLGVIHHDRGRFEEAQAAFEEALRINPNYTEAALSLAVTYNDLGRYDEAKRIYRAALARGEESPGHLDPFVKGKIANLHGEVARAYEEAGLFAESAHEYRKALLLCPEFADLRVRLASLYRQLGDADAARFELEEAVKLRPQYVPARIALGVVLLSVGNEKGALAQWEAAVGVDPENKTAHMYLRMTRNSPAAGSMVPPAPPADATLSLEDDAAPTDQAPPSDPAAN